MRVRLAISFIPAIVLLFSGCKTIQPSAPDYPAARKVYNKELSYVSIPLDIPLKLIEDKINLQFKSILYNDDSYTRPTADNVKIIVMKKRKITVGAVGGELLFTIPLNIWAQGRWDPCSFCPEVEKQTAFDVDVFLRSKVEILKNYQFRLSTSSDGFEWKTQPKISIGPINIPITALIEDVLDEQLQAITREIDRNVNGAIDLRDQVSQVWSLSQEPILIDDSTKTWLTVKPQSLLLAPVTSTKENLQVTLGLESFIETQTGTKPALKAKIPLPDLKQAGKGGQDFAINIQSVLGFKEATAIAKSQMVGQVFTAKKKSVKIEDIEVYGRGDLAYIRLLLSGSVKGELFLYGVPKFNGTTNEFYFENLDYDINTRSVLIKAANWLVGSSFQKMMQEKLRFSFDAEIKSIRSDLEAKLKLFKYKNLITLRGNIRDFSVKDIYVADDHFDIVLNANGRASVILEGADF